MNLTKAIREIEIKINEIKYKNNKELQPYIKNLIELRKINTACEKCGGSGEVWRRSCAEDDGNYYKCDACGGNGIAKKGATK